MGRITVALLRLFLVSVCSQLSLTSTVPLVETPTSESQQNIAVVDEQFPDTPVANTTQEYLTPQKYGVIANPAEVTLPARPHTLTGFPGHRQPYPYQAYNSNAGPPSAISIKNAFGFSFGSSHEGPYTSGYSYISSRTHHAHPKDPSFTSNQQVSQIAESRQATANFEGFRSILQPSLISGIDFSSMLMGVLMTYGVQNLAVPESIRILIPAARRYLRSLWGSTKNEKPVAPLEDVRKEVGSSENKSESRRNRRSLTLENTDADLTDLATIVVSAIQSGECMQRSICILGSQIGQSYKGKMAFILVEKMVPDSVRGHEYFKTLRNSLSSGLSSCGRIQCSSVYK